MSKNSPTLQHYRIPKFPRPLISIKGGDGRITMKHIVCGSILEVLFTMSNIFATSPWSLSMSRYVSEVEKDILNYFGSELPLSTLN
jgi:hypothetical protein